MYKSNLLDILGIYHKTDKATKDNGSWIPHNYTIVYHDYFYSLKESVNKVLEIGVSSSLRMWRDYFSNAQIFGIDINPEMFVEERITTWPGNVASRDDLTSFIQQFGSDYDIIIDDGDHVEESQCISLGFLFPHVKPNGYYIVEDLTNGLFENLKNEKIHASMLDSEETYLKNNIKYSTTIRTGLYDSLLGIIIKS